MKKLRFAIVLILSGLSFFSSATHIYEVTMDVQWLSNDSLLLTEYYYLDCQTISTQDRFGKLTINSATVTDPKIYKRLPYLVKDVTPVCSSSCSQCSGAPSCAFKYGIVLYKVENIISMEKFRKAKNCIVKMKLVGNSAIGGYTNSLGGSVISELEIDICNGANMELPKWKRTNKISLLCVQSPTKLDIGMTQVMDLDPHYYLKSLLASYTGSFKPRSPLTYAGFPNWNKSFPAGFNINRTTGTLAFTPTREEQTLVNVGAAFAKGSDTILRVNRMMTILVIKCPSNKPPIISSDKCLSGNRLSLTNIACSNKPFNFSVCSEDPNRDSVNLSYRSNIPGLSLKIKEDFTKGQLIEGTINPDSQLVSDKKYMFSILAEDNKCPIPGRSMEEFALYIYNDTSLNLDLQIKPLNTCGRYEMEVFDKDGQFMGDAHVGWMLNDTIPLDSGNLIRPLFTKAGTYKISATYSLCDTVTLVDYITIDKDRLEVNPLADLDLCGHEAFSFDLDATSGFGIKSIKWSLDNKLINKTGRTDSSSIQLGFPISNATETYEINYKVEDSSACVQTSSAKFNVRSVKKNNILQDITLCSERDTLISLPSYEENINWQGTGVDTSGRWFDSKLSKETINILSYQNKDSGYCIIDSAIIAVYKENNVKAGADFSICTDYGDSLLSGEPAGGVWTGKGVINNKLFKPSLVRRGKHQLIYTIENANGCKGTDTLEVEVVKNNQISISAPKGVCVDGDSVDISALPVGGTWVGASLIANTNTIKINPSDYNTGKHNFRYFFANSTGCPSSDTLEFTIGDFPQISISGLEDRCQNAAKFGLNGFPAGGTWTGTGTAVGSAYEVEPSQLSVGKNTYNYATQNEYCAGDTTVSLTILASPKADFSQSASKLMQGDSLYLTNLSTEINNSSYDWSISGLTTYTSQDENPLIISKVKGIYDIRLSITDEANKCTDILVKKASLEIEQNTGINNANADKVALYPNPVGNELTIDNKSGQNLQIEIIGLDGKTLWKGSSSEAKTQIDFSLYPAGIYQVIILGADLFKTQKVVKS